MFTYLRNFLYHITPTLRTNDFTQSPDRHTLCENINMLMLRCLYRIFQSEDCLLLFYFHIYSLLFIKNHPLKYLRQNLYRHQSLLNLQTRRHLLHPIVLRFLQELHHQPLLVQNLFLEVLPTNYQIHLD